MSDNFFLTEYLHTYQLFFRNELYELINMEIQFLLYRDNFDFSLLNRIKFIIERELS